MYAVTDGLIQQWSNELRLQSKAGGRTHWTVGAYWEKVYDPYSGFIHLPGIKLGGEQAQYLIAEYHHLATPRPEEWYSDYGDDHYRQVTEFGDLTVDLDSRWSVEGGIQHYHSSVSEIDNAAPYWAEQVPAFHSDASNRTNFKAGVTFKPTGHQLLYLSFAQGYRDGGFNYVSQYDNPALPRYFKPDHLDNYELGSKSDLLGGRVVWNSAAYYMRWADYQVVVDVPERPYSLNANAGDARIYGLESSIEVRPLTGLTLSFDGNYNDARISSSDYQSPVYTVVPGERLPEAPYFNFNAIARYERPINAELRAFMQFDAAHKGDMWNDLREDTRTLQPGYTICNVRIGMSNAGAGWTAEAYVTNAWNRRAVVFANYTGYSHPDIPTEPRVFGLRLSYRWGKT
jgi:outer membrane receptor protein involved in Fe transport